MPIEIQAKVQNVNSAERKQLPVPRIKGRDRGYFMIRKQQSNDAIASQVLGICDITISVSSIHKIIGLWLSFEYSSQFSIVDTTLLRLAIVSLII